jgi:hypothetical protein
MKMLSVLLISIMAPTLSLAANCRLDITDLNFYNNDEKRLSSVVIAKGLKSNGHILATNTREADYTLIRKEELSYRMVRDLKLKKYTSKIVLLNSAGIEVDHHIYSSCKVGTLSEIREYGKELEDMDCGYFYTAWMLEGHFKKAARKLTRGLDC